MTPQERQMIDDLFDRLTRLENAPRDSEASAVIADGLRRAPNAAYALTQTVLVQDEALRRANARIEELEGSTHGEQRSAGGFLDSMRDAIMGPASSRGSVPSVRPSQPNANSPWNAQTAPLSGGGYGPQPSQTMTGGGSSFLGTAAAAATGMIGGSLLMNGIRGLMGGGQQQSFGGNLADSRSPWSPDSSSSTNDTLARDAGINDVGKNDNASDGSQFAGSDSDWNNASPDPDPDYGQDNGQDDGGFDGGGSDYA